MCDTVLVSETSLILPPHHSRLAGETQSLSERVHKLGPALLSVLNPKRSGISTTSLGGRCKAEKLGFIIQVFEFRLSENLLYSSHPVTMVHAVPAACTSPAPPAEQTVDTDPASPAFLTHTRTKCWYPPCACYKKTPPFLPPPRNMASHSPPRCPLSKRIAATPL